jgi:hypothetical protein
MKTNDRSFRVYSNRILAVYDWVVLGLSNRFIWGCPTEEMISSYNASISNNHLDIGVGSGFFLDHCRFASAKPLVTLMDANSDCLEFTCKRIERYGPKKILWNVFDSLPPDQYIFDSIGLNLVLHCLPGAMSQKVNIFSHLRNNLKDNGKLFGATVLGLGAKRGFLARCTMEFYNRMGIFSNRWDDVSSLESGLRQYFREVQIEVKGSMALFTAVK